MTKEWKPEDLFKDGTTGQIMDAESNTMTIFYSDGTKKVVHAPFCEVKKDENGKAYFSTEAARPDGIDDHMPTPDFPWEDDINTKEKP